MQNKNYICELTEKIKELVKELSKLEGSEDKKDTQALRNISHQLKERAIELDLLYTIETLAQKEEPGIVEVLQEAVYRIPAVCKVRVQPCARIIFKELVLRSPKFKETAHKLSSPLNIEEKQTGLIEVCFPDKIKMEEPERAFKQSFLDSLAGLLGKIIERQS